MRRSKRGRDARLLLAVLLLGVALATGSPLAQPRPPDSFSRRFPPAGAVPTNRDAGAPQPPAAGTSGTSDPAVCAEVPAELRLSCPLTENVRRTRPIPRGIRLLLIRPASVMASSVIHRALSCQTALHEARPHLPPPCPFLGLDVDFVVRPGDGHVVVDLILRDEGDGLRVFREQVETAVGATSRR